MASPVQEAAAARLHQATAEMNAAMEAASAVGLQVRLDVIELAKLAGETRPMLTAQALLPVVSL